MTGPQYAALVVLANVDPRESVRGWSRSSQSEPMPRVNNRAAENLVHRGWATLQPLLFSHRLEYRITAAGAVAVVREDRRGR